MRASGYASAVLPEDLVQIIRSAAISGLHLYRRILFAVSRCAYDLLRLRGEPTLVCELDSACGVRLSVSIDRAVSAGVVCAGLGVHLLARIAKYDSDVVSREVRVGADDQGTDSRDGRGRRGGEAE